MTKQPQSMQQLLAERQSALYVNDSESPFTPPEADGRKCADRPLLDGENQRLHSVFGVTPRTTSIR
jgi:hypothetical protein